MKKLLSLLVSIPAISVCAAQLSVTPQPGPWPERWEEKLYDVKSLSGQVVDAVFVGDSITHGWDRDGVGRGVWFRRFVKPGYKVLNLGFGGDRTEHTLWRIQQGSLDGYKAKIVVLMIGTNNTGHRNIEAEKPSDTIAGVKAILAAIRERQSGAKIVLLPIFPRGATPGDALRMRNEQVNAKIVLLPIFPRGATPGDALRMRNEQVNAEICRFADGKNIIWHDFNKKFLESDGTLTKEMMPDYLHPRGKGYEIWAGEMKGIFDKFLCKRGCCQK